MTENAIVPLERIDHSILAIRGHKVILDSDLAALYGVETKALNRAVKRNIERFPDDFMFQLSEAEYESLRCHFGTSSKKPGVDLKFQSGTSSSRGGRRYLPYAFTEQGVAMLSSVLRSERAVKVNIEIMRAFVRLRRILQANTVLARQLRDLEKKYDSQFKAVFDAIRQLMTPPAKKQIKIGFKAEEENQ